MTSLQELANSSYALVTTFRKDGRAVPTPMWVAPYEDGLGVWSVANVGKVKRLRRSSKVTVATCDLRGNNVGRPVTGKASILDYEGTERVRSAIRRKYGLIGRITLMGSRIRRGKHGVVGIKIVLTDTRRAAVLRA